MTVDKTHRNFLAEPSRWCAEVRAYGASMMVVVATFAGLAFCFGHARPNRDASEIDNAVMVDLPPADAPAHPATDAAQGPEQPSVQPSSSEDAPRQERPPKPVEETKPEQETQPSSEPPPPIMPHPVALLPKAVEAAPPKPIVVPAVAPQDEEAPTGADAPVRPDAGESEIGLPHASAYAITLWQKTLMRRLEIAKHSLGHEARRDGTVRIAFEIDGHGGLIAERVAGSSGSPMLDRAAAMLVKMAAPFPAPPAGTDVRDLSFVVPIRFKH